MVEEIAVMSTPKLLRNSLSRLTDKEVVARNARIVKVASVLVNFTYLLVILMIHSNILGRSLIL